MEVRGGTGTRGFNKLPAARILIPMASVMRYKKNTHYPISALLLCFPKMAIAPFPVPLALPEPCYSPSRAEPISPLCAPASLGGHLECGEKDTA